jgi:hypothetical protein
MVFAAIIMIVIRIPIIFVSRLLTKLPIISLQEVITINGIIANAKTKLSTTWLRIKAIIVLIPSTMMSILGSMYATLTMNAGPKKLKADEHLNRYNFLICLYKHEGLVH